MSELTYDPSPLYALALGPPSTDGVRQVRSWMAFDPQYGPEQERQITWHIEHETPGAETWEVGVPVERKRDRP